MMMIDFANVSRLDQKSWLMRVVLEIAQNADLTNLMANRKIGN
jgi:hypothetical protein